MVKAKLVLICSAGDVDRLAGIVCAQARAGRRGDGVIFVSNTERAVKIRSGAENADALA